MKHYLVKRTVFNPNAGLKGEYQTDAISMSEKGFNQVTSTKEYQMSLRDNSVATPIKLEIEKEFADHHEYLAYEKELRESKKEKSENKTPEVHTEKTLSKMRVDEIKEHLIQVHKVDPAELEDKGKKDLIPMVLEKQEANV
jgi:hypothetical protein